MASQYSYYYASWYSHQKLCYRKIFKWVFIDVKLYISVYTKISLRQGSTNYSTQVKFQSQFLYYLQAKSKFYTCTFTTDLMIGNTKLVETPIRWNATPRKRISFSSLVKLYYKNRVLSCIFNSVNSNAWKFVPLLFKYLFSILNFAS